MSAINKAFLLAVISVFFGFGISSSAEAHRYSHHSFTRYPLTRCGPDLAYLCRLYGSFAMRPFHYDLAIYPGCLKLIYTRSQFGIERTRELVCGTADRPQVQW